MAALGLFATEAKKMSDLKVYINPGHGGYTSNDRPIHLYPYERNDTAGYWESTSNLYKGLHMYHILDSLGAKPYLSRIKNTEADDRSLSGIAAEANQLGVDIMISIHSNAGENINTPLMLYREQTLGTPRYPESVELSKIIWRNLHSSKLPIWTRQTEYVCGDLTFYQNMWQGGLGVLRTLYVNGLLSEGSMHEHRPEAHRLMNDDVCWLEAWHFVKSIMEFANTEDRFVTGNVAGIVYDNHNLREFVMPSVFSKFERDCLAPLNGASLELVDAQGKVIQTRTTDNDYNGAFVFRNVAPGDYKVRAWRDDYHVLEYPVSVVANEVSYQDMPLTLKRPEPLAIVKYSPNVAEGESVSCSTSIDFEFNTDVDTEAFEKAFSIEPPIDGYFTYSNSYRKVTFKPTLSFERDTKYTVTVSTEAKHTDNFNATPNLAEPLVFSFTTLARNRLELISQFPVDGGQVHVSAPNLEFRFDNAIAPNNIYDVVSVKDSQGNSLRINNRTSKYNKLSNGYGNIVYVIQDNLKEGESYTLELSTDLRDRENLPLSKPISLSFNAVDVSKSAGEATVIEDFENSQTGITYNAEQTNGIGTTLPNAIRTTSDKLFGKSSAKLSYKFIETHGGQVVWNYSGAQTHFETNDILGIHVSGDFNEHEIFAALTSGTDTKWVSLGKLDFLGWKYITVKLDMLEAGYPYQLSGFKLIQETGPITQQGAFCLDNITRMPDNSGITDVDASSGYSINPLPASGIVKVSAPAKISKLEIYNAAGATVAILMDTDTFDASQFGQGLYFMRISTVDGNEHSLRFPVK